MLSISSFSTSCSFLILLAFALHVQCAEDWEGKIEHVVVLMMENRAFDHMLGSLTLKNDKVNGCAPGKTGCGNPEDPTISDSPVHDVTLDAVYQQTDPCHTISCTTQQIFGVGNEENTIPDAPYDEASMQGFLKSYDDPTGGNGAAIMDQFSSEALPILSTLSEEFALFDGWFASVPGPTQPNRAYAASATSDGMAMNNQSTLAEGMPQKTFFKQLLEMGLDYRVYFEDAPDILMMKDLRRHQPFKHIKQMHHFYRDVKKGDLPEMTWLEPAYFDMDNQAASDQHPSHDVSEGELVIKKVYESLRASPLWEKTAFIVTYDEHGGFYDHVAPPSANVPNPDGKTGIEVPFAFDRLGVRIPTVVISPWVPKGAVVPAMPAGGPQYEHSSLAATIVHKLFTPKESKPVPAFLTKRDAWAATFETVFSENQARTDCPSTLPDVPSHRRLYPTTLPPLEDLGKGPLSDLQVELVAICSGLVDAVKGSDSDSERVDLSNLGEWTEQRGGQYCRDAAEAFLDMSRD
jgi:phospholipase C